MASTSDRDDAQLALDQLARVRRTMSARVRAPWWYSWGAALCTASIFVGIGLLPMTEEGSTALPTGLVVLGAIVGPSVLTVRLRRTAGVSVDRYARGMAWWHLVVFGLLAVGLVVQIWLQVPHALFVGAGVALVATVLLERHIDRLLVRRVTTGGTG